MKAFLASLHHAVWTRKQIDIAGSYFSPDELEEPLRMLEAAPDLLAALQDIPLDCGHQHPHLFACWKCKARAAIASATEK